MTDFQLTDDEIKYLEEPYVPSGLQVETTHSLLQYQV